MSAIKGLLKQLRRFLFYRVMLLVRGMTLGVRVIALNEAGHIVLVRHGYVAGWHLPGGGVDHHETAEQAACRELVEETGYRPVGPLALRGVAYNRNQFKGDHVLVYVALAVEHVSAVKLGFEIAEFGFFPLDALPTETTNDTRARLAEWQEGRDVDAYWG